MHSQEKKLDELARWLREQVDENQASGLVLQLSSDVNSAVVAVLAKRAVRDRALGLILPCHDSPKEIEDINRVADAAGIRTQVIPLQECYDSLARTVPQPSASALEDLAARLKMNVLHYFADRHRYLVVGTIDRSRWETGGFTRYGEEAADLQPVIHLLSSELNPLAESLDIPDDIIDRSRSARFTRAPAGTGNSSISYINIDRYLTGQFESVSVAIRNRVRDVCAHAATKKAPPALLRAPVTEAREISESTDQMDYDKSIEALTLISKAITSDQYVEDILRLIVMVTAEIMNSSVCSLWLLDEKEKVLKLRATQSINKDYLKDRVLRPGEGIVGKVVMENRFYSVPDVLADPFFKEKELAKNMGLVSMLSMPMRVKDRVIGVINCYTSHTHEFSDLQVNVLTTVANQAAVAIENTELMVKTKVIQEELEARKIIERAKDLIVAKLGMTGIEAYRWLQKRSMNTRKSMREVAEAVLLTMGT